MSRPAITLAALGVALPLLGGAALAQGMGPGGGGHGGMAVVSALCTREIATHCQAAPRGPAAWVCLNDRKKDLAENCRTAVEATGPDGGPGSGPVARLCMAEIDRHCSGVEHGSGKVRDCLDTRRSELGEGCKVALDNTGRGRGR